MQKLLRGIHEFQQNQFSSQKDLFERLANQQSPDALFITCSDSRVNPNLITQTEPGELFICRNAGNIVPAYGAANGGEGATIEFAVTGLGVKDLIVCGHSNCGAMKGILNPDIVRDMPTVSRWLEHAEATRWIASQKYSDLPAEDLLNVTIQENVLVQLDNLRTHPCVAAAVASGNLKLHGWVYKIATGEVYAYHPEAGQFLPVEKVPEDVDPVPARLKAACTI